jgi:mevalonate kinase
VLPVLKANVHVTLFQSKFDEIDSDFFNGPIEESPPFFLPIITLYQDLKTYFKAKPKKIKIRSMIPLSAGMGSSAALACALTKTFYAFYREVLTKEILFKWIQVAEAIAHHKPSGVDAHAIINQSALKFNINQPIEKIHFKLRGYLLIIDSKIKGSTKEAVQKIKKQLVLPNTQFYLDQIGVLSKQALEHIEKKQLKLLGQDMNKAHEYLNQLGLSHPVINEMVTLSLLEGAIGSKLTGGGLGGCMICLIEDQSKLKHMIEVFEAKGFKTHWTLNLEEDFQ